MSTRHVLIHVDGREVVLQRRGLTGCMVLAAIGAHATHGDLLIRDEDGYARPISPDETIEAGGAEPAAFRVRRGERPPDVEIDGQLWDWGELGVCG